ncbi:MAG: group 1 truncated hemoglobin [Croceitalea sp.]|nr:group 1 truncated hemoglobin [Croceitalea sp.]MBT8238646.1 group 1 truncated hemoglobin [Croceitalea sp.]NNM18682.1 group 1 truncated hemoglobin [Croceitalea sp.]
MTQTLFDRLGGSTGIAAIVDDAVNEHMNNVHVNARFLPLKEQPERLAIIKQHTIEFFSMGSGGPQVYHGKDMVAAHKGMNISPAEFMHVIDDVFVALDKNKMTEDTKKDVLAILWSLKGMIIAQ